MFVYAAGVVPNLTAVASDRPVPEIVTTVPPLCGPSAGVIPVTDGPATYVNCGDPMAVPPGVETETLTDPVPVGDTAVISVELTTVTEVAATEPNSTDVAPVRPVPVRVTLVPPPLLPMSGAIVTPAGVG